MPKKGTGRLTREEWRQPTEEMRKSPHRKFTLSREVHERLDKLPKGTVAAHAEAALRLWLRMPPRDDAPPRPEK